MKRDRSDDEDFITHIDMVKTLTMLSHSFVVKQIDPTGSKSNDNRFECKTCNRKFDSFQALGGHRASHKKPKLLNVEQEQDKIRNNENAVHKCSICGQMFGTGQALGGHMRKHRASMINEQSVISSMIYSTSPVMNRCNSSKMAMRLDLNLTPLENDLVYIFAKNLVPQIDLKSVN
ncbi:C2H2-type zinc finger family protein [Raphanus sativus]|uniref:Zinc finger protein ZAT18 n=1 Tax=Raphanus sativus TaxID=3726 RepID=A0A6J0MYL8_RAPSA|nr:zinc finger protein ZAT18 [Raphanus sativus]XP_056866039.1 zinc finger protein ZAT18-like [Raphanus sativus]KAJ4867698.1 C2H2-type zinc finger family protein [Raphanus sativus]KAJ4904765.1 C2H2-type zinc finger family protein [Raphanus sativus]